MKHYLAQAIRLPGTSPGTQVDIPYPSEFQNFAFTGDQATIGAIVSRIVLFIFAFAGIALLLMLLMAGFAYLTSAGDPKKLEEGKQRLTYAIVGFLVIFSSYWIVQVVGKILGVPEVGQIFR